MWTHRSGAHKAESQVAPGFHFRFANPSRGDHRPVVRATSDDSSLTHSEERSRDPRSIGLELERDAKRVVYLMFAKWSRFDYPRPDVPPGCQPTPVTFTFQTQLDGVCTSSCWPPSVLKAVTPLPDAAVPATAGMVPGLAPVANTNTWKAGLVAGAGVHWYAHPKFHCPLAIVNDVLVQLPLDTGVGPRRTATEPDGGDVAGAVAEDGLPGAEVVVDDAAIDLEVVLVELDVEPRGTGRV